MTGRIGLIFLRTGSKAGLFEYDNKPTGFIKVDKYLTSSVTISFSRRTLLKLLTNQKGITETEIRTNT
jgi:hypothetical protein